MTSFIGKEQIRPPGETHARYTVITTAGQDDRPVSHNKRCRQGDSGQCGCQRPEVDAHSARQVYDCQSEQYEP